MGVLYWCEKKALSTRKRRYNSLLLQVLYQTWSNIVKHQTSPSCLPEELWAVWRVRVVPHPLTGVGPRPGAREGQQQAGDRHQEDRHPHQALVRWCGVVEIFFVVFVIFSSRLAAAAAQDWLESGAVTCDGFSRLRLRPASSQQPTLGERARTFVSNVHRTLF